MLKYTESYQFPSSLQTPLHWNYIDSFQNTLKKHFINFGESSHKDVSSKRTKKIRIFDIWYGINCQKKINISQITWANPTVNRMYTHLSLNHQFKLSWILMNCFNATSLENYNKSYKSGEYSLVQPQEREGQAANGKGGEKRVFQECSCFSTQEEWKRTCLIWTLT